MIAELAQKQDFSSLSSREIIKRGIETVRFAEVIPLDRVLTDASIIDVSHARELGQSMSQNRGQLSPIVVRARIDASSNSIVYDVIDGFHRAEGQRLNGSTEINANVVYGCSDEELFDLRILAASSVRSVQFARVAQWISSSYESTRWHEKGLSVAQAFAVAAYDSKKSNFVDLTDQEIAEIKAWALEKSKKWGKTPGSIYFTLKVVENADPDLVRQVRTAASGGKDRVGRITPDRLTVVANTFPGTRNFAVQRAILRLVVERRLSSEQTEQLTRAARSFVGPAMTEERVYEVVSKIKLVDKGTISDTAKNDEDDDPPDEEQDDDKEPTAEELDAIEKGSTRPMRIVGKHEIITVDSNPHAEVAADFGSGEDDTIDGLKKRIKDLENALETASKNGGDNVDGWWRTAAYLTPLERIIFERVMFANESLDSITSCHGLTQIQVFLLVRSAFSKRAILEKRRDIEM